MEGPWPEDQDIVLRKLKSALKNLIPNQLWRLGEEFPHDVLQTYICKGQSCIRSVAHTIVEDLVPIQQRFATLT